MCSSNDIWKLGRLNHVAIATPNLTEASKFYKDVLRAKSVSPPEDLPEHGVTTVFVELDNTKIELLHPLGDSSPIAGFLKKNANGGIHHVCIEVDDIEAAVRSLKAKKYKMLIRNHKNWCSRKTSHVFASQRLWRRFDRIGTSITNRF